MLRKIAVMSITLPSLLLVSCGNDNEKEVKIVQNETVIDEGSKVERIPDATNWDPSWKKENTVIYHIIGEPDGLHPTNGISAMKQEINLYTQIYLVNNDLKKLTIFPQLAASDPEISANGVEYTYTLKDYIKWDDGSPVKVEDVIFTFKANKCPLVNNPDTRHLLEIIEDVIDLGNNKVKFIMREKYIANVHLLTDFAIIQRNFFDKGNVLGKYSFNQFNDPKFVADKNADLKTWANDFNSAKYEQDPNFIVGAGPYKLAAWDRSQSLTLVKKQNHWSAGKTSIYENAFPDKIIMKINTDHNATKLDFLNQVFDVTTTFDTKPLLELQKDTLFTKHYNHKFMDTYNFAYVGLNMKPDGSKHKALFTDKRVRKAMAMLIPYNDINKVINNNINKRVVGPVSPLKAEYNTDLKLIETNVEEAKKLLAEAGWKDSNGDQILDKMIDGKKVDFKFEIKYMTTTPVWENTAKLMAETMAKANIVMQLVPLQYATWSQDVHNHDFDMMLSSWAGSSQPEDMKQIWHSTNWANKGSNFVGFGNAESDALIDSARVELNEAKRITLMKKIQLMIYEEQPYIFTFASKRRIVAHKRFGNQEYYYEKPGLLLNNLKLISPTP